MTDVLKQALEEGAAEAGFADDVSRFDWRAHGIEDWISVLILWAMGIITFLQFFTRYVMNDSLAWTEEIASYLLIAVTFVGAAMAVRKNTHIQIEFIYRHLGRGWAVAMSTLVDIVRILVLAICTWLGYEVMYALRFQSMVVIEWPISIVYGLVTIGLAAMTLRAVQTFVRHLRTGTSALIDPDTAGVQL